MKTLVLTIDPAWPPVSGADLRNAQNAVAAAANGPVTLLSMRSTSTEVPPPPGIDLKSVGNAPCDARQSAEASRSRYEGWISESAISGAIAAIEAVQPDTIIVEGIHLFPVLSRLRSLGSSIVLDMHNIESQLSSQIRKTNPRRTVKSLLGLDVLALKRQERNACRMVDRIWVCSDEDEARLYTLHHPSVPIDIVPNGIPRYDSLPERLATFDEPIKGPRILFFGHLGYRPNITAAHRLATDILLAVRLSLPDASLTLAGRAGGHKIDPLADLDGVSIVRDPPDADAILADSDMIAVPLEAGGGTRLKILEAMAWGLPVIATPVAAEGLGLVDGEDFVCANTDDEFARAIVDLWADRERFEAIRNQARITVMHRFGKPAIERAVRNGLGLVDARQTEDHPT